MLPEKVELLFGAVPAWADPDDPEDRAALFAEALHDADDADDLSAPLRAAFREILANQIAGEDPPEVWATARRLLASGLDRANVLAQLTLALATVAEAALRDDRPYERAAYLAALDRLPVPTADAIVTAMVDTARALQPVDVDELEERVAARLGIDLDDEPTATVFDRVSDRLLDGDGPLELVAPDLVVDVASITEGIVLTHRLAEAEVATGELDGRFDLAGYRRRPDLRLGDGSPIDVVEDEPGRLLWVGPGGWLNAFPAGAVVAVTVAPDGLVEIERLEPEPTPDTRLVALLRQVYETEVGEPWLPVPAEDLVLGMLARDRSALAQPRSPLAEMCAAAGLERGGGEVAHEESVWANRRRVDRMFRLYARFEDVELAQAAMRACEAADAASGPSALVEAMADLRQPEVLAVVADELLGGDDPVAIEATSQFAERLGQAAVTPGQRAVARWLAAVVAERRSQPLEAEGHLQLAVEADPRWSPAVDRRAWYASDRGDAVTAARLWTSLGIGPDGNPDLAEVLPFARPAKPGRNDPCWCGSGRKFKLCHLGQPRAAPLEDRVGWLCRKAVAYLERRGSEGLRVLLELAAARAAAPGHDAFERAMADPLVVDAALHERGWFELFLADRGPLLPEDEQLLAASWLLCERTVYEVLEARPGAGVLARDLRTGDRLDVRERAFSTQARAGQLVCARVVPDGVSHQFVGGLFTVPPGTERVVMALLEESEPEDLLAYLAAAEQPPSSRTREGEPMVVCEATVEVADPAAAARWLDTAYEREGDDWVELYQIDDDERILRATIRLAGSTLSVHTTSEPRMERVLTAVVATLPGARLVHDRRRPVRPGDPGPAPPLAGTVEAPDPAVVSHLQDRMERRWMREAVPALGGLTPVEAAADPTRREELERLLASFPALEPGTGGFGLRPDRLRQELGLDR